MRIERPEFLDVVTAAASREEQWITILKAAKVKTMAEVGIWKGEFARAILRRCRLVKRYYMIDPWAHLPDWNKPWNLDQAALDEVYEEAMKNTRFASSRRIVLRGRTKEVIDCIPDRSLDFAYIDGDHTLRGITIDLVKLLPKIKKGGLIGGDDFLNGPHHDKRFEPTLVCPFAVYFAEAMDLPIVALPGGQFLIQNNPAPGFVFVDPTGEYGRLSVLKEKRQ